MKILHANEPTSEGVFTVLRHLAHQQVPAGHDVHVLAPPSCPRLPGVTHHDWSLVRGRPLTYPRAVRELRRAVRTTRPDVVHLHSFFAGVVGRVLGGVPARPRVPVLYQPHAWSTNRFTRRPLVAAVVAAERLGARRTDLLLTNCQDELDRGARMGVRRPGRVVGVAVDLQYVDPVTDPAERRRRRAELGLGESRVALVLGRLTHQKGQDLLVRAWEENPPRDAELALVGPGDPSYLAPLAPTQWGRTIRAHGLVEDPRAWLQAADVLLLPSRYETVGLAVAEAMAAGLPVVATAVDGVRPVVVGGDLPAAGAVVDVDDVQAMLAEAEARLADEGRWRRESLAARQRAEALFEPRALADAVEAAYREAVAAVATAVERERA